MSTQPAPFGVVLGHPSRVHLLFERGRGILGWVVRTFTRSKYAHVAVGLWNGSTFVIVEPWASMGIVRVQAYESRKGELLWVPTRIPDTEAVRAAAFAAVGQKYDWIDAFRAGLGLAPRNQGYQCAEMVAKLYQAAGAEGWDGAFTPQSILDALRKFPGHLEAEVVIE